MTDERAGLPSASGMERLKLCPGSWALEQQCPEPPETEEATSGTRIHDAWAGKLTESDLTADEVETLDAIKYLEWTVLTAVFKQSEVTFLANDDQRFWMMNDIGMRILSGKPDRVYSRKDHFLILDAKTGRNETTIAAENVQLRSLAVIADTHFGYLAESITVGILAPWQSQRITLARYERHHLDAARKEILDIIAASKKPDAPRIPSLEACRYCKAKAVCPEARQVALEPAMRNMPEGITPEAIAATLTGKHLGEFLRKAKFAKKVIEACEDDAKRRLEAGEEVPGWTLKDGRETEEITDPQKVFGKFAQLGGTPADFMECIKVRKGELTEKVGRITGTTGKGLKAQMKALLEGATETKVSAKQLEEV